MSSNPILDDNDSLLLVLNDENEMKPFPPSPAAQRDLFDICSSVHTSHATLPRSLVADDRPVSRISSDSPTLSESCSLSVDDGSFQRIGRREVAHSARLVIDAGGGEPSVSFTKAYVLACLVFWLCGFVAGSVAYIEAVKGEDSVYEGDAELAKRRKKNSYFASIAGIFIGLIAMVAAGIILSVYYFTRH